MFLEKLNDGREKEEKEERRTRLLSRHVPQRTEDVVRRSYDIARPAAYELNRIISSVVR